jgi:hypothetical protein
MGANKVQGDLAVDLAARAASRNREIMWVDLAHD